MEDIIQLLHVESGKRRTSVPANQSQQEEKAVINVLQRLIETPIGDPLWHSVNNLTAAASSTSDTPQSSVKMNMLEKLVYVLLDYTLPVTDAGGLALLNTTWKVILRLVKDFSSLSPACLQSALEKVKFTCPRHLSLLSRQQPNGSVNPGGFARIICQISKFYLSQINGILRWKIAIVGADLSSDMPVPVSRNPFDPIIYSLFVICCWMNTSSLRQTDESLRVLVGVNAIISCIFNSKTLPLEKKIGFIRRFAAFQPTDMGQISLVTNEWPCDIPLDHFFASRFYMLSSLLKNYGSIPAKVDDTISLFSLTLREFGQASVRLHDICSSDAGKSIFSEAFQHLVTFGLSLQGKTSLGTNSLYYLCQKCVSMLLLSDSRSLCLLLHDLLASFAKQAPQSVLPLIQQDLPYLLARLSSSECIRDRIVNLFDDLIDITRVKDLSSPYLKLESVIDDESLDRYLSMWAVFPYSQVHATDVGTALQMAHKVWVFICERISEENCLETSLNLFQTLFRPLEPILHVIQLPEYGISINRFADFMELIVPFLEGSPQALSMPSGTLLLLHRTIKSLLAFSTLILGQLTEPIILSILDACVRLTQVPESSALASHITEFAIGCVKQTASPPRVALSSQLINWALGLPDWVDFFRAALSCISPAGLIPDILSSQLNPSGRDLLTAYRQYKVQKLPISFSEQEVLAYHCLWRHIPVKESGTLIPIRSLSSTRS